MDAVNLRRVVLTGTDGVALVDGRAIPETVSHVVTGAPGSAEQTFESKMPLRSRQPREIRWLPAGLPYFVGFTASWRNHAAWLQECLPKLVAFVRLAAEIEGLKLIVPRFATSSFHQQTLDLLSIGSNATCIIDHEDCIGLDDAWLLTKTEMWSVPPVVAQSAALLRAQVEPDIGRRAALRAERIYLRRRESTRRVSDFDAIRCVLDRYGFAVVSFNNMPLSEQIATMRAARFVIGEHGAGLANILFCKPNAQVLELFNPANVEPAFWSIASVNGLGFGYIVGSHVATSDKPDPDWNTAYDVPPTLLENAIRSMPGLSDSFIKMSPRAASDNNLLNQAAQMQRPSGGGGDVYGLITLPIRLPVGPYLKQLLLDCRALQTIRVAEPAAVARAAFFHNDSIDTNLAVHGRSFLDDDFWMYQTEPFEVSQFAELALIGSDGIVFHDGSVIPDTLNHIMTWLPDSITKAYEAKTSVELRISGTVRTRRVHGSCFIGFTASWRNYAHWLQETVPKLLMYLRLREQSSGLKIVLPTFVADSFQHQTIKLLGIEPESTEVIAHREILQFQNAWVATHADIWRVPPLVIDGATALLSAIKAHPVSVSAHRSRIYLHRAGKTRTVSNFQAVEDLVRDYGFSIVSFDDAPIVQQAMTMQAADFVIGEHGAGLANIVFCRRGTSVLELFNPACVQPEFWSVASVAKLNYGYLVGTHVAQPTAEHATWNTDYDVPLDRLEAAIRSMPGISEPTTKATVVTPERSPRARIIFTDPGLFEIGEIKFAFANAQPATPPERVVVFKDRGFIEAYEETFSTISPRRAFEFGIYLGGNSVFLTALLGLEKFVCVDSSEPVEEFAKSLKRMGLDGKIKPYFRTSQDSSDRIRDILQFEFGDDPPDLIIDDASHRYAETKQSFQIAFPYLKNGGFYIIEDWSWAHWPENQNSDHGWNEFPALSNLILELVLLLPSSDLIEWMTIKQGYAVIKKKASRHSSPLLNIDDTLRLRGRILGQI